MYTCSCIVEKARQEVAPGRIREVRGDDDVPDLLGFLLHRREYSISIPSRVFRFCGHEMLSVVDFVPEVLTCFADRGATFRKSVLNSRK